MLDYKYEPPPPCKQVDKELEIEFEVADPLSPGVQDDFPALDPRRRPGVWTHLGKRIHGETCTYESLGLFSLALAEVYVVREGDILALNYLPFRIPAATAFGTVTLSMLALTLVRESFLLK